MFLKKLTPGAPVVEKRSLKTRRAEWNSTKDILQLQMGFAPQGFTALRRSYKQTLDQTRSFPVVKKV